MLTDKFVCGFSKRLHLMSFNKPYLHKNFVPAAGLAISKGRNTWTGGRVSRIVLENRLDNLNPFLVPASILISDIYW